MIHSARLERWLGADRLSYLSQSMVGWYSKPIPLLDVPGCVAVDCHGDFVGSFDRGGYYSAADALDDASLRAART